MLRWLAEFVWRRPLAVILAAAALAVVCIIYASSALILNANTDDLIAPDRPYMVEYRRFLKEFGDLEFLLVVVENSGDAARAEAAVDALTARLRQVDEVPGVFSGVEPREQLRIATRAMPEEELEGLAKAAGAFAALRNGGGAKAALDEAAKLLTELIQSGQQMAEERQERTGAAAVFLLNAVASARPDSPSAQELAFLLGQDARREYFKSDSGRYYFVMVMPVKDYGTLSVVEEPLRRIRAAINEVREAFPDVNIGLTGRPVLQADEMATSNADMTKASLLAFSLCAALFIFMFRGVLLPIMAVIAFACGASWTYGFATLTVGQLNLLSVVFVIVLVGVGMDYGVHVLSRYREYKPRLPERDAIVAATLWAGRGNITGAVASATVFFMAMVTTFQGLRELGWIAGGGLLLCLMSIMLVLPAELSLASRWRRTSAAAPPSPRNAAAASDAPPTERSGWWTWIYARPGAVLLAAAALTIALVFAPGGPRFEYNLLELQAEGLESVEWEHRVLDDSAAGGWFGAVVAEDLQRAAEVIDQSKRYTSIGEIDSVLHVIEFPTPRREALREEIRAGAAVPATPPAAGDGQANGLTAEDLQQPAQALDLIALAAVRRAPEESQMLQRVSADLKALAEELRQGGEGAAAAAQRINENLAAIAASIEILLQGDLAPLREAIPEGLRQRYMSPAGNFLVMLHPSENVWEYEPMKQFIDDLRSIDPGVTGSPITHFESLNEMHRSFIVMSALSLLVISLIVWIDFRSFRMVLLALAPTTIGMAWLVESMSLLGVSFNLANFFSVPILIGLSVDGSVHILHRYVEGGPQRLSLGATRRAVIVTALTTIIGFGCLMLAHHRGLRSLGQVMALGSALCLVATIVLLPAMLAWLERLWMRKPSRAAAN